MMKVCCLFLFSLVIVMPVWASTSESDIVLQPVNTTEVDEDGILFLQVKETTSWSEAEDQRKQCTKSKVPWGKKGEISVNVVNGTNLTVSLALPPKKQIFTHSKDKKAPTSAMVYLEFEGPEDGCDTPDGFTLDGAEDWEELFFVLSTRTVGDSRIEVLNNKNTFVGVSRCKLSISLKLNFTDCQDWHGDEGDILKLAVPITEKFTYTDLVNVTYRFEPCISYISFEYDDNADSKRVMRFLEEPESAIKTVENCPFNQTRYEEGLCQVCPTPTQAPTTLPTVAPSTATTSGLDAGSYVILSIMGVGFILTVGIVIQSYRK